MGGDIDVYESIRDVEKTWSPRMVAALKAVYGNDVQRMWDSFCDAMQMMMDGGGDMCQKEVKQLKCPLLILHGEKDYVVPSHHPQWVHDNVPGSEMYVFPGGKHNIRQRFAPEFNKRILEF